MIPGHNKVFEHGGKPYHIQVEDLGVEQAHFEVRVYDGGAVLWRKRLPYTEILARALPKLELEEELSALMDKTIHTVEAAIVKGKIGGR